ncbi:MAG: DUF4926 domain-containing protein [bacterium]
MLKEHDVVALTVDRPQEGLAAGDVGAVVHCYPDGSTFEVEFIDDHGRSRGVVTLTSSSLFKLNLISLPA